MMKHPGARQLSEMRSLRFPTAFSFCFIVGLCLGFSCTPATIRADASTSLSQRARVAANASPSEVQQLTQRIDQRIAARWTANGVKPAPLADDAEYLRRLYLDLAGRIPRVIEVRDFLDDTSPTKRQQAIERLLEDPQYAHQYVNHFTNAWRALLINQTNNQQVQFLLPSFEAWLRHHVQANTPYDELVQELLTTPIGVTGRRAGPGLNSREPSALAFYQANDLKAENLAASTTRLLLGVKLECAQCHDHPHDHWTRKQFWEYAAFFSGLRAEMQGDFIAAIRENPEKRSLKIPGTERVVFARFLDGSEPRWNAETAARTALAQWLTDAKNPYFARAAVNRLWAHFFGIGLIEPVDEVNDANPPSHPELLDELARQFVAHRFDIKFILRAITNSQTYQRSSDSTNSSQNDARLLARMAVKGMSPEQFFDSLAEATGFWEESRLASSPNGQPPNSPRALFLAKFSNQEKATERQTSILQALALMNGQFTADATSIERSKTLAAVVDAPFLSTEQRIETLYLAALSRKPRAEELARLVKYVAQEGPKDDPKAALADVFWALLNSGEFMLNH